MGLTAALRHDLAVDDRGLPGHALPGAVGVPGERALVRVVAGRPAVRVEVREPVELRVAVGVVLVHHVDLHLAEAPREGDLAGWRHILRREEQHLVAQERLVKRAEQLVVHLVRQREAGDLTAEIRSQRPYLQRPWSSGRHGLLRVLRDSRNTTRSVCSWGGELERLQLGGSLLGIVPHHVRDRGELAVVAVRRGEHQVTQRRHLEAFFYRVRDARAFLGIIVVCSRPS